MNALRRIGTWPIFPLLVWVYPVVNLYANNARLMEPTWALPALAAAALAALMLLAVGAILFRDTDRVALLAALLGFAFFYSIPFALTVKHATAGVLGNYSLWGRIFGGGTAMLVLGVCGVGIWWLMRHQQLGPIATLYLNVVCAVLVTMPLLRIGQYALSTPSPVIEYEAIPLSPAAGLGGRPDIYYIILDGYARDDVLAENYGFDNSAFLQFLEQRGFYVAANSRSNYALTFLSLPTSLNMESLYPLRERLGPQSTDATAMYLSIQDNRLMRALKTAGYTTVRLVSSWTVSSNSPAADLNYAPWFVLNEFNTSLLQLTPMSYLLPDMEIVGRRAIVFYDLERIARVPEIRASTFTFLHLWCPHPPYIFDRVGEIISTRDRDDTWHNQAAYVAQVEYLNRQIEDLIETLLTKSETPPIIVLQSDHGPDLSNDTDWAQPSAGFLKARFGILNAYYLPGGGTAQLYPAITPVNSFRVILNYYFAAGLELLDDSSFFSSYQAPYNFSLIEPCLLERGCTSSLP